MTQPIEYTTSVRGIEKLERALATRERKLVVREIQKVLKDAIKPVRVAARQDVGRDTGQTRAKISLRSRKARTGGIARAAVGIRKGSPDEVLMRGFFQEFGTVQKEADSFLIDNFDSRLNEMRSKVEDYVQRSMA